MTEHKYYAWKNYSTGRYEHIYPNPNAVRMCFPYDMKLYAKEGKIVEVKITEV